MVLISVLCITKEFLIESARLKEIILFLVSHLDMVAIKLPACDPFCTATSMPGILVPSLGAKGKENGEVEGLCRWVKVGHKGEATPPLP